MFEHSVPRRWHSLEVGGTRLEGVSHWGRYGRFEVQPPSCSLFLEQWNSEHLPPLYLYCLLSRLCCNRLCPSVTTSQPFVLGYLYQSTLPQHRESNKHNAWVGARWWVCDGNSGEEFGAQCLVKTLLKALLCCFSISLVTAPESTDILSTICSSMAVQSAPSCSGFSLAILLVPSAPHQLSHCWQCCFLTKFPSFCSPIKI